MQGYGNAGNAPRTTGYREASSGVDDDGELWRAYEATRPHVAPSAAGEAAAKIVANREAIVKDALARKVGPTGGADETPYTEAEVDEGLRVVASALVDGEDSLGGESKELGAALASHLVGRMCVPRDMGLPAGFELRQLARQLGSEEQGDAANSGSVRKYD